MKISAKLILSFSIMAGLAVAAGILSLDQTSKLSASFDTVRNKETPSIIALGNIKSDFNALHAAVLAYNLHVPEAATDPEIRERALDHLDEVNMQKQNLLESVNTYRQIQGENFDSNIATGVDMLIMHVDEMTMLGNEIMNTGVDADHAMTEEADHAANHMMGGSATLELHNMILQFNDEAMMFNEELDAKIAQEYTSLENTQTTVLGDIERSNNLNMLLTVGAVAVVFTVGGLAALSITRRVSQLKAEANKVAAGNLNQHIATTGSDEIHDLASNFEHMRKSLVAAQEMLESKNKELHTLNIDLEQANKALKKLDKLKDQFIAIASHELRTPIHPILGYASMARSGHMKPEVALDVIYTQALKLKKLASDILDVSRIESGTLTYNMQKINIHEVLLNALVAAEGMVDPKQVSIIADIDKRYEDLRITADKDRMGQVFTNIIGNATKFTRKGSIKAETHVNKDANTFEIVISDTGGGIPEDLLPNLFGKFVTKNVGNMNKEGSGLGLYISRAIVTAHDGTIQVYNHGEGATFKIVLPIDPVQQTEQVLAQPIKEM